MFFEIFGQASPFSQKFLVLVCLVEIRENALDAGLFTTSKSEATESQPKHTKKQNFYDFSIYGTVLPNPPEH